MATSNGSTIVKWVIGTVLLGATVFVVGYAFYKGKEKAEPAKTT